MPERIFCVDFGSAFTKVALRTAAQEDGKLIPCSDEGLELWAPTVVAADWTRSSTEPRLEFGYRAAAIKPGGKIVVYSNFKKDLFTDTAAADGAATHPLDALLMSDEFTSLADKYNVPSAWVHGLRTMAGRRRRCSAPTRARRA